MKTNTVQPTVKMLSLYLKARYLRNHFNRQEERGRNINLRTSVQEILLLLDMPATLPVTTRVVTGRVASMHNKKKSTILFDEDSDDKSEGYKSCNSCFSQTSFKEQQGEPELPRKKQSERLHSRTSVQEILLLLDVPASLPVTTRVLTGRVAGMHNKKKSIILFDEDSIDKSEGYKSCNSHFSQTSFKEQQGEPELTRKKQSERQCSVWMKRGTIAVGVQSLEDIASNNDAFEFTSSQFSRLSLLNNEESFSATAIDQPSKNKNNN